ncbi:MAG TPA: BatA domain-containing protein, partial [Myxococcaceae bacterium]|nr:BatA domain-containing protein [Myxococcaceae bacterium]
MTFAHPWFLLGTLAALIPLAIHLFDRRRPRTHPFAAIAFVLKSQRRTASRLKLRRILLYTLRTLILLAIPLALARPERRRPEAAAELKRGAAATAIVLDASLSMRARDAGEVLFAKAQGEARAAIRGLLPEEPANLVVCGGRAPTPTAPGFDRARLRTQVDEARPSFAAADLSQCLEWAARSLEESPVAAKRLVVISDFSAHAFRLDAPPPMVTSVSGARVKPDVVLRDVAGGRPTANLALVDLKVEPVPQSGPRAFQFTLTARNFSAEPVKNQEVSVRVNDRVVAKGFLDIPPQGTAQKALQHRFDGQGVVSGEVALAPDALEADDRRAFVVAVPRELRALVVNGSPQTVRYRDEAFFVEAALTAPGSPVQPTVRDVDAGYRENFSQYDLVLLLNAQAPSEETAARLRAFVDGGGGLFIALGDAADPDAYTRRLGALLPRPLRLVKTAATREEPDGARKAARIGQVNWEHPVFSLFQGDAREGLTGARFYRYTLLESEPGPMAGRSPSEVLAAYEDGAPAVAAARVGRGRVLLFTSTVDRDWSDFSLRTSFL